MEYKIIDIYLYNAIYKTYEGVGKSDKNPLDPETPIMPANSTTIKPPEKQEGYAVVWVGNKWEYKEDHRNEVWYNASTKQLETINFIGDLPNYYYTPDSPIANKPDGEYWIYDSNTQTWVGDALLYKQYVLSDFNNYWEIKQNTPFEVDGFKYIASWRDLYTSIWVTLKDGIKSEYRLQDFEGKFNTVTADTMRPIIVKMSEINDEMYLDKQNLEVYFTKTNDFNKLQNKFNEYIKKEYK